MKTFAPDTHVYCTNCIHGEQMIRAFMFHSPNNGDLPSECVTCYPFDPEDSRPFELRKNYEPISISEKIMRVWEDKTG